MTTRSNKSENLFVNSVPSIQYLQIQDLEIQKEKLVMKMPKVSLKLVEMLPLCLFPCHLCTFMEQLPSCYTMFQDIRIRALKQQILYTLSVRPFCFYFPE